MSRRLDARLLRFVIDGAGYTPAADDVIQLVRETLPALRAAGIVLGIENHDRFPSALLRGMIGEIGSEHVGSCLDTANSPGAGEGIGEVFPLLAPVCVNLHLKYFAIARLPDLMGFTVTGRSPGQGQSPIDRVLSVIAEHGRCDTAVLSC
jgi:3-oxoisoapionate decarboxylase